MPLKIVQVSQRIRVPTARCTRCTKRNTVGYPRIKSRRSIGESRKGCYFIETNSFLHKLRTNTFFNLSIPGVSFRIQDVCEIENVLINLPKSFNRTYMQLSSDSLHIWKENVYVINFLFSHNKLFNPFTETTFSKFNFRNILFIPI